MASTAAPTAKKAKRGHRNFIAERAMMTRQDPAGSGGGSGFMKPISGLAKRPMFGRTVARSFCEKPPYHFASVAEYSSTEVLGNPRPSPTSSGPPSTTFGYAP